MVNGRGRSAGSGAGQPSDSPVSIPSRCPVWGKFLHFVGTVCAGLLGEFEIIRINAVPSAVRMTGTCDLSW